MSAVAGCASIHRGRGNDAHPAFTHTNRSHPALALGNSTHHERAGGRLCPHRGGLAGGELKLVAGQDGTPNPGRTGRQESGGNGCKKNGSHGLYVPHSGAHRSSDFWSAACALLIGPSSGGVCFFPPRRRRCGTFGGSAHRCCDRGLTSVTIFAECAKPDSPAIALVKRLDSRLVSAVRAPVDASKAA
jgi:hypothetical protein